MTALEAYQIFLGLNTHFFTLRFDYFRYGGVPVKLETFENKTELEKYRCERLSNKFANKEDLENFIVANLIDSKKRVFIKDIFGSDANQKYLEWTGRIQSAQYLAATQVKRLLSGNGFNDLFKTPGPGQHPEILKAYLRKDISIETVVLLDLCVNFFPKLDEDLEGDRTWTILKNKAEKYRPFIQRVLLDINSIKKSLHAAVLDATL